MNGFCKWVLAIIIALFLFFNFTMTLSAQIIGNGAVVYVSDNEGTFDPGGATYVKQRFSYRYIM